eukprot:9482062-Pyramimonas_sp.AAC.1
MRRLGVSSLPKPAFFDKKVYVHPACKIADAEVSSVLRLCRLSRVGDDDIRSASIFIANDPANPGQRILWASALVGGTVGTPSFFTSH